MQYQKTEYGFVVRLDRGEEVMTTLTRFAEESGLGSGSIVGIGAISDVELGYFDFESREYSHDTFEDEYELINLTGNISVVDNMPFVHAHVTIGDKDYGVKAGHLFSAVIAVTGEFFVTGSEMRITRVLNQEIGLKLLSF